MRFGPPFFLPKTGNFIEPNHCEFSGRPLSPRQINITNKKKHNPRMKIPFILNVPKKCRNSLFWADFFGKKKAWSTTPRRFLRYLEFHVGHQEHPTSAARQSRNSSRRRCLPPPGPVSIRLIGFRWLEWLEGVLETFRGCSGGYLPLKQSLITGGSYFQNGREKKVPWAPKTTKYNGFGHLKTRLCTIKTSKNVGFGGPMVGCNFCRGFFRFWCHIDGVAWGAMVGSHPVT